MPSFALRQQMPCTFGHCSGVKMKRDSSWNFSFFTNPFDAMTWFGVFHMQHSAGQSFGLLKFPPGKPFISSSIWF